MIRWGVLVSIAAAPVLAGFFGRRSALGESLAGATLGVLLVAMVRTPTDPLEPR